MFVHFASYGADRRCLLLWRLQASTIGWLSQILAPVLCRRSLAHIHNNATLWLRRRADKVYPLEGGFLLVAPSKMLAILLLAALVPGCSGVDAPEEAATGRIDGTLIDQLAQPYGEQEVRMLELGWTTWTTPRGGFSFVGVPPGTHTLEAVPAGGARIREVIEVVADNRTVIFLQTPRDMPRAPSVSVLSKEAWTSIALPGEECESCAWTTHLIEHPEEVVLRAEWEDELAGTIVVDLLDGTGQAVARVEGQSPLWTTVAGHDLGLDSTDPALEIRVYFGDVMPQTNYHIRTFLDVYYGADRETQG